MLLLIGTSCPPSSNESDVFHWFVVGTGFDIITPDELKARRAKDPSWGVDLVIDCSGYAPAMEEALLLINPGGKMCIFGVTSPQARIR
jgi:threonine dehydrogenase-like Zn-dependent dehydrogenase